MRKVVVGAAVLAAGLAAVRFGPTLAERGMKKCHEMTGGMQQGSKQPCACHEEPLKAATV
jgi:hypothetical protein